MVQTMRDKSTLEYEEKMCVHCCNFDKEHIGMDGTAFCKLTMTLAYAEEYGGNCMFYNVPKEQIIVPPCKVGDTVWFIRKDIKSEIVETNVEKVVLKHGGLYIKLGCNSMYETTCNSIGKSIFLTKEEAEQALKEREG